jgi:hypothetical protein
MVAQTHSAWMQWATDHNGPAPAAEPSERLFMLVAIAIFIFTIILVIWQPKGLGVGWSATMGAILALAFGVISLTDIPVVWHIIWNATGTFVALIISLLLDEAGFFAWAALHVARWGADAVGGCLPTWCCSVRWSRRCLPMTARR